MVRNQKSKKVHYNNIETLYKARNGVNNYI